MTIATLTGHAVLTVGPGYAVINSEYLLKYMQVISSDLRTALVLNLFIGVH